MSETQKSNRGRKPTLTESARKRHRKEVLDKCNKTRIVIGDQYDRWTELKSVLRVNTHAEVAKILLNW